MQYVQHVIRGLLVFLSLAAFIPVTSSSAAERSAQRPNIILIMADDLGAKELSCYGHPRHRTPHLDRLARTGVQFRHLLHRLHLPSHAIRDHDRPVWLDQRCLPVRRPAGRSAIPTRRKNRS